MKSFAIALFALLGGCSAVDLQQLEPIVKENAGCFKQPAPGAAPELVTFLLPRTVQPPPGAAEFSVQLEQSSVQQFVTIAKTSSAFAALPATIREDAVTQALVQRVLVSSAAGQLATRRPPPGAAPRDPTLLAWPTSNPSHRDLEAFARKLFSLQLSPTLKSANPPAPGAAAAAPSAFEVYFKAYYGGTFVDRFGQPIQKPSISVGLPVAITITDAQIAAAETFLLEYLIDSIDPTPILGDTVDEKSATTFYPGGQSKPTALVAGVANYRQISLTCGVTKDNVTILNDIASAAGDKAGAIGGLTINSAGGFGVSFGVFGKVSIGDNQTLSTLAKTAVTRFAMRASYSASFWLLNDLEKNPPGAAPRQPAGYLDFAAQ